VTIRRLGLTFVLVLNSATLILTVLTLGNAESLSDVAANDGNGFGDLLVIARADASLLTIMALLSLAGTLVLGYALVTSRGRPPLHRADPDRPRISGE
jgi:hypothetical protein